MPVEQGSLLSRSRPVVSHGILHWPLRTHRSGTCFFFCKVEEALKGSYVLSLKMGRVVAQLSATILASTDKASLEKMDTVGKEQESQLRPISIHGALPGQSRFIGINELKNVLKSFHLHFDDVKKAVEMATPFLKRVENQEI